jgi:hypothetical protein
MPAFGAAVAAWATLGHINLKSTPLGSRHLLLLVFRIQYRRTFLEMNRSLPNLAFASCQWKYIPDPTFWIRTFN